MSLLPLLLLAVCCFLLQLVPCTAPHIPINLDDWKNAVSKKPPICKNNGDANTVCQSVRGVGTSSVCQTYTLKFNDDKTIQWQAAHCDDGSLVTNGISGVVQWAPDPSNDGTYVATSGS